MLLGYNTNGWSDHDPLAAVELLAAMGYRSVAITLDHGVLNPYSTDHLRQLAEMRRLLDRFELRSVVETGARFLLDPRHKHEPTLVSADAAGRARRVQFLKHAIDAASELGSDCVSFWSGTPRDEPSVEESWSRLVPRLREVIGYAEEKGIVLGFEPEPGMFIDTMLRYEELLQQVDAPHFRLTLDIGHLHCQGETPIGDYIRRWSTRLVNVHIEDMRRGIHQHLMFGEGEIDFPLVFEALREVGYQGGVHVELSRHSHEAPAAAERAMKFLSPLIAGANPNE